MSYAIPSYYDEATELPAQSVPDLVFVPRSRHHWVAFVIPALLAGASWAGGGFPGLTDIAFLLFTIVCAAFLTAEFYYFPRRFGIGGLVLYGGVLCWFCQDYFTHWFNQTDFTDGFGAGNIAKVAFLHILFVGLMSVGLNIQAGRWAWKSLLLVPDPGDPRFFLCILLLLFGFGLTPYMFFCNENFFLAVFHAATATWTQAPAFNVYRDGNLNYNWGAYVAQIMGVGEVSGLLAIVYAITIARNWYTRLLGVLIWSFYVLLAYHTGRRGDISFNLLPPIALLFIKYQARCAAAFRKFSVRGYVICAVLTLTMQLAIQIQGRFRGGGLANADVSKVHLFENAGNTMFSEGLLGYYLIPDTRPFVYAGDFPGEGFVMAMPQTTFDFVVGIIPRALWHDKPVDKLWSWYNKQYLNESTGDGTVGTTISHGLVGSWYFKFGMGGVVEGALLVGWLMGVSERALQNSEGKPIGILMSLSFAVWLFRTYRDFIFIDLYGLIIGGVVLSILVYLFRPLLSGAPSAQVATG